MNADMLKLSWEIVGKQEFLQRRLLQVLISLQYFFFFFLLFVLKEELITSTASLLHIPK